MSEPSPDLILAACAENNGPMLLAVGWALLALATIVVFLRIVFRHRYGNGLRADDYTMLASMVLLSSPSPRSSRTLLTCDSREWA